MNLMRQGRRRGGDRLSVFARAEMAVFVSASWKDRT
jgi:hypothetical protein